jgi:hypothetical protein
LVKLASVNFTTGKFTASARLGSKAIHEVVQRHGLFCFAMAFMYYDFTRCMKQGMYTHMVEHSFKHEM